MNIPIISDVLDALLKFFTWIRQARKFTWAFVLGFIVTPVNWCVDRVLDLLGYLDTQLDKLINAAQPFMDSLGISGLWAQAGPWLSKANAIIPLDFVVQCVLGLCALWVACAIFKLVRKLIPFI